MNNNDFNDFANAMGSLAEIHSKEISPTLMKTYFKLFFQFSIEQIQKAVSEAMLTLKYFPKPVELIELIQGKLEDKAEIELSKVVNAIRRHGAYSSIVFDDPVTMAVIQNGFGGWIKLCDELLEHELKWFRKDFLRIWQAYHAQGMKSYGKLTGLHESNNSIAGLSYYEKPVLIGNINNALEILEHHEETFCGNQKVKQLVRGIGQ